MTMNAWAAFEDRVEVVAKTDPTLREPNIVLSVARKVRTSFGDSEGGFVHLQPDVRRPPLISGFFGLKRDVFTYLARDLFAGSPRETASFAKVDRLSYGNDSIHHVLQFDLRIGKVELHVSLYDFGDLEIVERAPHSAAPFTQQGIGRAARSVSIMLGYEHVKLHVPKTNGAGGPALSHMVSGVIWR